MIYFIIYIKGELGWELYMKNEEMAKVYSAIKNVGKTHQLSDFGTYAMNCLRIEKGFRAWGLEVCIITVE